MTAVHRGLALLLTLAAAGCMAPEPAPRASFPSPAGPAEPAAAERPSGAPPMRPARLLAGSPDACLAAIEAVAAERTGNRVILGTGAFSRSHELVLERMPRRGHDGLRIDGRMPPPEPVVLSLFVGPDGCRLVDGRPAEAGRGGGGGVGGGAAGGGAANAGEPLPACRCAPL